MTEILTDSFLKAGFLFALAFPPGILFGLWLAKRNNPRRKKRNG
jgi:hypothetical protein